MRGFGRAYRREGHQIIISVPPDRILYEQQQQAEPEHSGTKRVTKFRKKEPWARKEEKSVCMGSLGGKKSLTRTLDRSRRPEGRTKGSTAKLQAEEKRLKPFERIDDPQCAVGSTGIAIGIFNRGG